MRTREDHFVRMSLGQMGLGWLTRGWQGCRRDTGAVTAGTNRFGTATPVWEGFQPLWWDTACSPQKVLPLWGSESQGKEVYASKTPCSTTTIRSQVSSTLKISILVCILPCSWMSQLPWHVWKLTHSSSRKTHQNVLIPLHFASTLEARVKVFYLCLPAADCTSQYIIFPSLKCSIETLSHLPPSALMVRWTPPAHSGSTGIVVPMCSVEIQQGVKVLLKAFLIYNCFIVRKY